MRGRENFALLMEMRTGKSKTLLDDFGRAELAGDIASLFVLAPGGVYRTWVEAVDDHLSSELRQRTLVHVWQSGAGVREKKARAHFMAQEDRPRILLMNVEALSTVAEARAMAKAFLLQQPCILAVDESTCIGNPTSKRTKFITRELAGLAKWRRILSGLPTPRDPLSLFSQFEFLHWKLLGFKSFYAYRARFAVLTPQFFGGRTVQVVKGFRDLEVLQKLIEPHSFRVRLRDCADDMPEKTYSRREVSLTPEQRRVYNEMKEYATAAIGDAHATATVKIAQLMRMHQVLCGHIVDEDGNFHEIPENRTAALLEVLEEYDGKAIVWCSYDHDVRKVSDALREAYGKAAVAQFWGGNVSAREEEERRFKADPACRFMVATASAGGRGRTWDVADLLIYYSNGNDLEHRLQSEERGEAIGKKTRTGIVDLVATGTIDEKLIESHRAKITMASTVMGDGYKEWLI